jgi:RND family efflux transporter MFP subunit
MAASATPSLRRAARAAVLALGAAWAGVACDSADPVAAPPSASPAPAAPERVVFQPVEAAVLRAPIAASGSIAARRISEIGAEVAGRLVEISVDLGDWVEAGAPLFQIDPVPYRAALAEARAGLKLARAEAANAAREEARARELMDKRVASQQSYEALLTQAAMARARVEQMEARVEIAERDLERTRVTAPYAGSIIERRAHEGALASGDPIIVLQESGALEAVLNVPEASLVPVRVGDPVLLFVEGIPEPLRVAVTRVSDRVQPDTRTYEVRAALTSPAVKAGSYVRAEIFPAREEPRPVVPDTAIRSIDGRSYAFRLADGQVERVRVRLGVVDEGRVEVLAGLAVGDRVAVGDVVQRLGDGAPVLPANGAALPAGAPEAP